MGVIGYHATTPKKLARHESLGLMWGPVFFWKSLDRARSWARDKGRTVLLELDVPEPSYPLPSPRLAWWTSSPVRSWRIVE